MGRRSRRRIADAAAGVRSGADETKRTAGSRGGGRAPAPPGIGTAAGRRAAAVGSVQAPSRAKRRTPGGSGTATGSALRAGRAPAAARGATGGARDPAKPRRAAPDPPWAPFPLVELAILIALVLLVAGFVSHGSRGGVLLGCGLGLTSLASLELTIREHFAGYRSHAALLAGAGAVAVAALLYAVTGLPQPLPLAIAAAVFGTLWRVLGAAYARALRAGAT